MPVNILNLPGLCVLDFKETDTEYHVKAEQHGAAMLVKEWAMQHRNELMEDWKLCEQLQTPNKIAPLE